MSNNTKHFIIRTETYSDTVYDILNRLQRFVLSDNDYIASNQMISVFVLGRPDRLPNGEVIWRINTDADFNVCNTSHTSYMIRFEQSVYYRMKENTNAELKIWLASIIKKVMYYVLYYDAYNKIKIRDKSYYCLAKKAWTKNNKYIVDELSGKYINIYTKEETDNLSKDDITVSDVFCLCDVLYNLVRVQTYSKDQLDKIIRVERDPLETEVEILYQTEIDRFEQIHKNNLERIETDKQVKIKESILKISEDYNQLKVKQISDHFKKIERLRKAMRTKFGLV